MFQSIFIKTLKVMRLNHLNDFTDKQDIMEFSMKMEKNLQLAILAPPTLDVVAAD